MKPTGYKTTFWVRTSDSGSTGTTSHYTSKRHAYKRAEKWMSRGPSFYVTHEPIFGPLAISFQSLPGVFKVGQR